jgi:hypothetical protein
MQPTESTPSEDVHASAINAGPEASPESSEEKASPSWWNKITGKIPSIAAAREEPDPRTEEPESPSSSTAQRTVSDEEFQRLVQSEADKRVAAANKAARDAAREEERRRLREEDPWQYVEQERQEEEQARTIAQQDAQLNSLIGEIGSFHDRITIDPLIGALPAAEVKRIRELPGAGVGAEGRELIVRESLAALERHWKAEGEKAAEQKLRRNPSFRKQVLAEMNGGFAEPEMIPPSSGVRGGLSTQEISDRLRQAAGIHGNINGRARVEEP